MTGIKSKLTQNTNSKIASHLERYLYNPLSSSWSPRLSVLNHIVTHCRFSLPFCSLNSTQPRPFPWKPHPSFVLQPIILFALVNWNCCESCLFVCMNKFIFSVWLLCFKLKVVFFFNFYFFFKYYCTRESEHQKYNIICIEI